VALHGFSWVAEHLDTGQTRTNFYHHPERLLAEPDDDDAT
jgi:hypothetical protein